MYFCPKCSYSLDIKKSDDVNSIVDFFCSNCGYKKKINDSLKLYELNKNNSISELTTIEDNKILAQDPTLPRTKDYICKNINCISHKDKKNREAVYFRDPKNFSINYICNVCYYKWEV